MADAYGSLYEGNLPATLTTLLTAGAGTGVIIKHWSAVNISGSTTATFQLSRNGYAITPNISLLPGQSAEWDGTIALTASTELFQGIASSASTIAMVIDGDTTS